MKPIHSLTAAMFIFYGGFFPTANAAPRTEADRALEKDVTAAQVNGAWRCGKNTIKIRALGGGRLQVDLDCVFEYKSAAYGKMANMGQAAGAAKIEGDTAVFFPTGDEKDGTIKMKFSGGKMIVQQEGTCGFGHRVSAAGSYEKASAKKPKH